jgi:large subunit ribosomal protein L16
MLAMPRKVKHSKEFKGRIHGLATQGGTLSFGSYGLQTLASARMTARQIEAARRAITRHMRRLGRVWVRVFPNVPVTSKPAEVRMGSGKGSVDYWACRIKPGRILFEIDSVSLETAQEAFRLASAKLPFETRLVHRQMRGM